MSNREPVDITKEKMTVLCVKPGEKPKRIEIESSLDALQRAVGGYIEAVYPYEDPVALIVNEEGKLNGLPLNRALRDEDNDIYDIVAGTFLVVGLGESEFVLRKTIIYSNKISKFGLSFIWFGHGYIT